MAATQEVLPAEKPEPGDQSTGSARAPVQILSAKRKRGNPGTPRGTYNKRTHRRDNTEKSAAPPSAAKSATETLCMLHEFVGLLPGFDCMPLDAGERATVEKAFRQFSAAYPEFTLSPRITAWCTLAGAAAIIYGPRYFLIREELRVRNAKKVNAAKLPDSPAGNANPGSR